MTGEGLRVKLPPGGETIKKHQWYLSVCVGVSHLKIENSECHGTEFRTIDRH